MAEILFSDKPFLLPKQTGPAGYTGELSDGIARLPGEPETWYRRYTVYRLLGPARTLNTAFYKECGIIAVDEITSPRMPQEWKTAAKIFRWKERVDLYDGERIRELLENERQEREDFRAFSKEMLWEALKKIKSTFKKLNEDEAQELSWHSAVMATSTLLPLMDRLMTTSAAPELPGSKKGKPLAVKMYLPASDGSTISPRNWLDELPEDDETLVMESEPSGDPANPEPVENA